MSSVRPSEFEQFFTDLHGYGPFPWQIELARRVCEGRWPKAIDVPTGSGKTACIDVALFALAVRGDNAARRIFFVVDRRVIVSEAFERANKVKRALEEPKTDVLTRVAAELKQLAEDETPLHAYELRGGAFRDETWVRSPLQPAVIASTVDQVGSRLLFRGYGVSPNTWPVHAGLIANDALILLDEAHCSRAFAKTLECVEQYRGAKWASKPLGRPFHFVEMTATPAREASEEERIIITDVDRHHPVFKGRLFASKPVQLAEPVKCRKDEIRKFAAALIEHAKRLASEVSAGRVAIILNRVSTAKEVYEQLITDSKDALLVIGRMRPLDRDSLASEWAPLKSGQPRTSGLKFVVSTQCLEVGADLDFDVMVSECASIDALQQRFGRLDRIGEFKNSRGTIVVGGWQLSGKGDPVYGEALARTWEFLESVAEARAVDMGIEAADGRNTIPHLVRELPSQKREAMKVGEEIFPLLLPAHLDALAQTNPRPVPEPEIEYFLHGKRQGVPDVYVIWRSDLDWTNVDRWGEIVNICPPTSMEAMPVPLWVLRNWLREEPFKDQSDAEVAVQAQDDESTFGTKRVLVWRDSDDWTVTQNPMDILPGTTVILPEIVGEWNELGHKPEPCPIDRGDEARLKLRKRCSVRLREAVVQSWPGNGKPILAIVSNIELEPGEKEKELREYPAELRPQWLSDDWDAIDWGTLSEYPDGRGWFAEGSFSNREKRPRKRVLLREHLDDVVDCATRITGSLLPDECKRAVDGAAKYHDYGKVDPRYQAWLRNGDVLAARYAPEPIAKSGKNVLRKQTECGLPDHFRHELLSLMFAAKAVDMRNTMRDLILHLVASHHGYCRALPSVVIDDEAECVKFKEHTICRSERLNHPPHSLGYGISDRFWRLTRQYGWWGLAYLEAMLRLADWQASEERGAEV